MKLTRRQQFVLDALKRGCRLWRYSKHNSASLYLVPNEEPQRVQMVLIDKLEDAGLIEEDAYASTYRDFSGSDIVYKVTKTDMNQPKPNDRVGALCDASGENVRLFGFGVYVGDEVPPEDIRFSGAPMPFPNPKIQLDSGKVVWGCECWWGPEDKIKETIAGKTVTDVDIDVLRAEANKANEHPPAAA